MLSLKLVRSLVLGKTINNPLLLNQNHHDHSDDDVRVLTPDVHSHHQSSSSSSSSSRGRRRERNSGGTKTKTPLLIFLPTREVVRDTYRLATIARDMGMDLYPSPSLSHVIFLWPSSSSSSSPSVPSLWSSSSSSWSFTGDAIPLPFPSLATASTAQLRSFVGLSKGLFKLAFCNFSSNSRSSSNSNGDSHWDCSSLSLYSRLSGERIDTMDGFCRALAGMGWTLFKTKNNPSLVSGDGSINGVKSVHLFRKVDSNKVGAWQSNAGGGSISGEFRIRELRLPPLDFTNAPLRIFQYIILMTDDLFYLA